MMEVKKEDLLKFTKDYREMESQYTLMIGELNEAIKLLGESLNFMNKVPNNIYGDNYKIASDITVFINELNEKIKDL